MPTTATAKTTDFEMYTPAGNRACQAAVNSVTKKILGKTRITAEELEQLFEGACKKVSQTHREVYDTEPRWHIGNEINKALKEVGYGFRIDYYGGVQTIGTF
jgi:hypothetical protein